MQNKYFNLEIMNEMYAPPVKIEEEVENATKDRCTLK